MAQIVCIRLEDATIATLRKMAKVDGKDVEIRLSEVVEELIALSQEEV